MAKATKVIDGDTIELLINLGLGVYSNQTCRLYNIDTPELRAKNPVERSRAVEAKNFTQDAVEGQLVKVYTQRDKRGKYGRLLCELVYSDYRVLSQELKKHGHQKRSRPRRKEISGPTPRE